MPQSLTQLPETAEFEIGGWCLVIRDHKVVSDGGLWEFINHVVNNIRGQSLYQFEKHGISFEAAIEYCAYEYENYAEPLTNLIFWQYNIESYKTDIIRQYLTLRNYPFGQYNIESYKTDSRGSCLQNIDDFSKSNAGRKIAAQYIEKIRSCDNWGDLYDEMRLTSRFNKDVKNRIIQELEEQNRTKRR